eukprot:gene6112-4394_t
MAATVTSRANDLSLLDWKFVYQLGDPVSLHALVCGSLTSTSVCPLETRWHSTLLDPDTQLYMKQLLHAFSASRALRERLRSTDSLTYLAGLTDEATRDHLIQILASGRYLGCTP